MSEENKKRKKWEINKIHYVLLGLLLFLIAVIRGVEYLINQGVLKLDENMSFNKFIFQLAENMTKSWITLTIILLVLFISYVLRQIYNKETISGKYITALLLAANLLLIGKWYQSESVSRNLEQLKTKWYLFVGLLLLTVLGYFIVLFKKKKKEDDRIFESAMQDSDDPLAANYRQKIIDRKNAKNETKTSKAEARRDRAKIRSDIRTDRKEARRDRAKIRNDIKIANTKSREEEKKIKNQIKADKSKNRQEIKEQKNKNRIEDLVNQIESDDNNEDIYNLFKKSYDKVKFYVGIVSMISALIIFIGCIIAIIVLCLDSDKSFLGFLKYGLDLLKEITDEVKKLVPALDNASDVAVALLLSLGIVFALILIPTFLVFSIYFAFCLLVYLFTNTDEDHQPIKKFAQAFKVFFFKSADDIMIILLNIPDFISDTVIFLFGEDQIDLKIDQILGGRKYHFHKNGRHHNPNGGGNSSTANPMSDNAPNADDNNPNDDSDTTNPDDNDPNN